MAEPRKNAGSARAATAKKAPAKTAPAKKAATKKAVAKQAAPVPATAAAPAVEAPPKRSTPLAASGSTWSLAYRVTAVVLVLAAFLLLLKLNDQQEGGPAHGEFSIGDGIPATLYLPVDAEDDGDLPEPLPKGERPPVIVMAHGYSADRASMSGMARSLARAGYAVLNIDLRGHGSNTHAFRGDLRDDFAAAVDWATTTPWVDGSRLAVLGHSMGAGAALDFATIDNRAKAVVPVSGGWVANDAVTPAHTLFLVGSGDPDRIAERQDTLARELRKAGGQVTQREISADHITILRDGATIGAITEFLDPLLGIHRDGPTPGLDDPRMKTAALYLLVALALVAVLGLAVGQAVPAPANAGGGDDDRPVWSGFAMAAVAMVLAMPLLAVGGFDLLPIGAGQPIVMHLLLASALLWGGRALAQRGQLGGRLGAWLGGGQWLSLRTGGWAGLAASAVIVSLLIPMGPVFHRMVPTPERAVYWVVMALASLPFYAAYEALLRRGRTLRANIAGALGKVLLLAVMFVGLGVGALPSVIGLILPLLVLQFVLLELFAATAYARGRNTTMIAVVDAVLIGFVTVALTPIG
jgi:dienelactone hydrolase